MAKKKAVVKRGIFLNRHQHNGKPCINVSIHSDNGNKLASRGGYNTRQNAMKGISALHNALVNAYSMNTTGETYTVTDLTKPVKKAKKQ